jgi:hypothetical protein
MRLLVMSGDTSYVRVNENHMTLSDRRKGGLIFIKVMLRICTLLRYYAASSGNPLPTFRDNVSVPSSRVKKSKKKRTSFLGLYVVPKRRQRITT